MESDVSSDAEAAVALVQQWLAASEGVRPDPRATHLADLLREDGGLDFAIGFVDRVVRPDDLGVAARALEQLALRIPRSLPRPMRAVLTVGGPLARLLPWPIVPLARQALRGMVGHLVIVATPTRLGPALERLRADGDRLTVSLLGAPVLGEAEAKRRLTGLTELVRRPDVDQVSLTVAAIAGPLNRWASAETVDRVVERLVPLYEEAALGVTPTRLTLDLDDVRDLDLTIDVFQRLLDRPSLRQYEAGIMVPAAIPQALSALDRLTSWAQARRAAGGAGITVHLVAGAILPLQRVDAALNGWSVGDPQSTRAADAAIARLIDAALRPDRVDAVRIGVVGRSLLDLARAWLHAEERGVTDRVEVELPLGMAPDAAAAVRRTVGSLRVHAPVVAPKDVRGAIPFLVRRLQETASTESGVSEEGASGGAVHGIATAPDTDPAQPATREWARAILERAATTTRGQALVDASALADGPRGIAAVERIVAETRAAGAEWALRSAEERADILHRCGRMLADRRADLLEVMVAEAGKTLAEGDPEVSEAIDFAHYYAESARDLARIDDAAFTPVRLTVVVPPWNSPVAIPAGGVLAALAAGSAVIITPAPQTRRSAAVMVEALWDAGVPRDVLRFVDAPENEVERALIAHPAVDRLVLTGAWETAALFRSWRPDLPIFAETSGKNAIVITPSADLDLAVADLVRSAFGHAGQKRSAASLAILVGSVATSERFERQLVDAVRTLRVGRPLDPTAVVGPLVEPAAGKLLDALTRLDVGEEWLVEPRALDEAGRLWSPGVKRGVAPGSAFHTTEYLGPVLGLMRARDLDEALDLQNGVAYGLTAGLHSLDAHEVEYWLDHVEAGNLSVNRGITGAIVRRQPFGGWKRSSVGGSTKAGGPSYVMGFGSFAPVPRAPRESLSLRGLDRGVREVLEASQPGLDFAGFDAARAGALSDQRAWEDEFGIARDVRRVEVLPDQPIERSVLRYRPVPVTVRAAEGAAPADLIRVLLAATRSGSRVAVSSVVPLPVSLLALLDSGVSSLRATAVDVEPDTVFAARVATERPARIRVIAPEGAADPHAAGRALLAALDGDPDVAVWSGPVTAAGRVELLPFLREQAVSITAHRFGNPYPALAYLSLEG